MASSPLPTPEELRQLFNYGPETGKLFWRPRPSETFTDERAFKIWTTKHAGKEALANLNAYGYRFGSCRGKWMYAHRVVWAWMTGEWPEVHIDHINHDRADNRFANLRAATVSENQRNRSIGPSSTSGHVGVTLDKRRGTWQAHIKVGGKRRHLGSFVRIEDAIACRREANERYGFHENHGARATIELSCLTRQNMTL